MNSLSPVNIVILYFLLNLLIEFIEDSLISSLTITLPTYLPYLLTNTFDPIIVFLSFTFTLCLPSNLRLPTNIVPSGVLITSPIPGTS